LGGGGSEKIAAQISIFLKDKFIVSIVCIRDNIDYAYKGKLYNLGQKKYRIKPIKQFCKLLAFRKLYKKIDADVYVDFRMRNRTLLEIALHLFVFKINKMVFTIHSSNIFYHLPKFAWFYNQYAKARAVVCVSKAMIDDVYSVYPFQNLKYIPNFITNTSSLDLETKTIIESDYVIAVGRLNNHVKQFDRLIDSYKNSKLFNQNIPLYILGEGPDRQLLEYQIKSLELENHVKLLGLKTNALAYMNCAKFLILSSQFEGFPLVLLEALSVGTPVVSFDCHSGPSEIIDNKSNGLLVESQNFEALTKAMNLLFTDEDLYKKCQSKAINSIEKFSSSSILPKWLDLLQ
jgi:N-acetylgalactosamine-N,N'-diacetylbacillosaminyl-diphospho-undecaprenol 4-alpha-N-acetylgalactosaminyltransferase